jgi:hypothetical protein
MDSEDVEQRTRIGYVPDYKNVLTPLLGSTDLRTSYYVHVSTSIA